eukprot:evm.model.scf_410.5 EVM.evm.TU.scf_410.5   scf_410:42674-43833(+)
MPKGEADPADLWSSSDVGAWKSHLALYRDRADAKPGLGALDRWFFDELPGAIRARDEPRVTRDELVRVVEWKLKRGRFRPRLLGYARGQGEGDVRSASAEAYGMLATGAGGEGALRRALARLCELKGVGPATASALLAAFDPSCPFMSDEALRAALGGAREYTAGRYMELAAALRSKAEQLGGGDEWTAREVEMSIYSCAHSMEAKVTGAKRKRGC